MSEINEAPRKSISDLEGWCVNSKPSEFMGQFPRFIQENYISPLTKKRDWSVGDLDTLQNFMENTISFSLQNSITLLSMAARGGEEKVSNETGHPTFGLERDFAIHDLALQALEYCEMFNSLSLGLIWELKRQKEGGAQ